MFDTYKVKRGVDTVLVPYTKTVHEHRAPTDDSIRIYQELKEKAYASLLASFDLTDNIFDAKVLVYKDYEHDNTMCAYSFLLNGIRFKDKFGYKNFESTEVSKNDLVHKVYEGIAKQISKELIKLMYENKQT